MEKQITILHANDLHGSLNYTVNQDLIMQGGISLLSGYVKKVRRRGPVFFGICVSTIRLSCRSTMMLAREPNQAITLSIILLPVILL